MARGVHKGALDIAHRQATGVPLDRQPLKLPGPAGQRLPDLGMPGSLGTRDLWHGVLHQTLGGNAVAVSLGRLAAAVIGLPELFGHFGLQGLLDQQKSPFNSSAIRLRVASGAGTLVFMGCSFVD